MPTWTKTCHKLGGPFSDLGLEFANKTLFSCGRQQRFMRFNVVSASEDASLHTLVARRVRRFSSCCCDPFSWCAVELERLLLGWDGFCWSLDAYCVQIIACDGYVFLVAHMNHMCTKKSGQTCGKWTSKQLLTTWNYPSTDGTWTEARRLVDSKLLRIFLSSDDLARIVGIVSARDILSQVLDQLAWQQGIRQKEKRPWWWKVDWDGNRSVHLFVTQ